MLRFGLRNDDHSQRESTEDEPLLSGSSDTSTLYVGRPYARKVRLRIPTMVWFIMKITCVFYERKVTTTRRCFKCHLFDQAKLAKVSRWHKLIIINPLLVNFVLMSSKSRYKGRHECTVQTSFHSHNPRLFVCVCVCVSLLCFLNLLAWFLIQMITMLSNNVVLFVKKSYIGLTGCSLYGRRSRSPHLS